MSDKYPGLSSYTDRHGKLRWRYRTKDRVVSLPAPNQPGFKDAYQAAVAGRKVPKAPVVQLPGAALPGSCGVDFNPVLPQRDIDQLAYAHQQVLGLVWRGDEAAKKLFNMDASKVPNRHVPPDERVIWDHPQFQKFFDQPRVFALAGLV
ncbi:MULTISPECIES: hypothetical protein [unclassified Mesorhizobium]|uniref:hypothetical protein n=1 Tax=unclassified Mesorhizobium TaxID=325217 RepID=UPI0016723DB4|nr:MULTISPECIES: hypothetical protein [unclassified Mesorhizobium]